MIPPARPFAPCYLGVSVTIEGRLRICPGKHYNPPACPSRNERRTSLPTALRNLRIPSAQEGPRLHTTLGRRPVANACTTVWPILVSQQGNLGLLSSVRRELGFLESRVVP